MDQGRGYIKAQILTAARDCHYRCQIFSVSTFIVQVLSYFTTSKENALAYFIDDFMMAGPG